MSVKRPVRVIHFVTGGFSGGATQVALALVKAQMADADFEPLLVLRKKRRTPPERLQQLKEQGIPFIVVPGWSKVATIYALIRTCRRFEADVLMAHGFSEHLWGRYAGLLAKVPHLVHVEHNTKERYNGWRLRQSLWLAQRTDAIVGCSEGVKQVLLAQGQPAEKVVAISNGIQTAPFSEQTQLPWEQRNNAIVMVARYSRQKDHATLLRAVALLRDKGICLPVYFAGGGKSLHRKPVEALAHSLKLDEQVNFLGVHKDVPGLYMANKFCVLSTHYEGMPLALIEGMAAGCLAITSRVPGAQEVIKHGDDGYLFAESDPKALAELLQSALEQPQNSAGIARAGREKALNDFSYANMHQGYRNLLLELCHSK